MFVQGADWVDPDDPMLIAENELLGAAESIEKAAKKLASLKPRREVRGKVGITIIFFDIFSIFTPIVCHKI
jgi:hypothetical protein